METEEDFEELGLAEPEVEPIEPSEDIELADEPVPEDEDTFDQPTDFDEVLSTEPELEELGTDEELDLEELPLDEAAGPGLGEDSGLAEGAEPEAEGDFLEEAPEYLDDSELEEVHGDLGVEPPGEEDEDELLEDLAGLPSEEPELSSEEEAEDIWSEAPPPEEPELILDEDEEPVPGAQPAEADEPMLEVVEPESAVIESGPEDQEPAGHDEAGDHGKSRPPRSWLDPLGPEAGKLFVYLRDLSRSLPADKQKAMSDSGVDAKLDYIIENVAPREDDIPEEIHGVPVSKRLAKLISFMRKEKRDARS